MTKKAIVLAAGMGTRLRPLTATIPKPLMPVWGEPMLARIVGLLRSWGVDDIQVNSCYLGDKIEAWCASNGCGISRESEILGTGGALNPLREWIGNEPFYLVNADIVVEGIDNNPFPPDVFARREVGAEAIGACIVAANGPQTLEVEPESRFVTNWKSDDAGVPGTFTYCGIALLKPEILQYIKGDGFSSIIEAYEKAMMEGRFIRAIAPQELLWSDAGTISSYIELNRSGQDNAFAGFPQLQSAFASCGNQEGQIEFLGARGSDRCFFRSGNLIAIIYDDSARGENARYAGHARWLKEKGIAVPEIVCDLPEIKTQVMEYAGSEDFAARIAKRGVDRIGSYLAVVEELAKFNSLANENPPPLEPAFDRELWRWEVDLFREQCLASRFRKEISREVAAEFERIASLLEAEPRALVHRDFQSSNVIWKNDRFSIIDFQGMRVGPAVYDLASLIYDPYVKLTEKERRALAGAYARKTARMEVVDILPFAAVQRMAQALGAFGRLAGAGHASFGKYVLPALENMLAAADEAGLEAIGALAEDLIASETHRQSHCH